MYGQMQLRRGLPALFCALILSCPLCVHSEECVNRSSASSHKSKKLKINIVGVEFRGENPFSDETRAKLVKATQESEIEVSPQEPDTGWANVLGARTVIRALRAQGYMDSSSEATPYLVRAESDHLDYVVSFTIKTGPQYRIGAMQVRDATAFDPRELRAQILLNPGEIYNEDAVLQGIESMKQLYGAKGYIDMQVGMTQSIDRSKLLINTYVETHEGTRYRVGRVQVLGLGSQATNLLRSIPKPGEIFDSRSLADFLNENKNVLPVNTSEEDITVQRNYEDGTADIVLDFRRCSKG
jgi:outer membrane protein assembly factor BamA